MTAEQRVEERLSELTQRVRASADRGPRLAAALISGAAGALAVTAVHQLARRRVPLCAADGRSRHASHCPRHASPGQAPTHRPHVVPRHPGRRSPLEHGLLLDCSSCRPARHAGRCSPRDCRRCRSLLLPPVMGLGRPPHAGAWSNRLMTSPGTRWAASRPAARISSCTRTMAGSTRSDRLKTPVERPLGCVCLRNQIRALARFRTSDYAGSVSRRTAFSEYTFFNTGSGNPTP